MSDGVLPTLFVVAVIGEVPHDELVDAVESQAFLRRRPDRHHDQRVVRICRLFMT